LAFLLAHLSDPHIGPLPKMPLRAMLNKRLTGAYNWHRARANIHDMDVFKRIIADLKHQKPNHIALTGDLVNVGFGAEFPQALTHLEALGPPHDVSIIPGNHDAYLAHSLGEMSKIFGAFMQSDDSSVTEAIPVFPYLRRREGVALIGVNSGIPTAPFMATGRVGKPQRDEIASMLRATQEEGLFRVLMVHHPALPGGTRFGRWLQDRHAFGALLRESTPDLVIHGHNHRFSIMYARKNTREIPVIGVGSASAVPGSPHHQAEYLLYRIEPEAIGARITVMRRGYDAKTGEIKLIDTHIL
jgi:3',5'-cyclic AMP phosphodiesterase CpdA